MSAFIAKSTAVLAAAAVSLAVAPAFARGGGGGHGGGGHGGGGGGSSHSSSSGHSYGGGGHYSSPSSHYSSPHYSSPHYSSPSSHYSSPHYSAPSHYASPHYASPSVRGGGVHYASPGRGSVVMSNHGYIGGGRGAFVAGGRVPAFYGGRRGGVWWGPGYGWRVPAYWGGYYRPYPAYWGVGYWVTDWIMLDLLAAEEARMIAYGGPYAVAVPVESAPLDNGVREELRSQVEQDLDAAPPQGATSTPNGNTLVVNDPRVATALAAPHHVYVVTHEVAVNDRNHGGTCNVTQADVLRSGAPIPSGQSMADVIVVASKKGSCAQGTTVSLPIAELVHFEQDMLERVSKGAAAAKAADAQTAPNATQAPADAPPPQQMQQMPSADDMPAPEDMSTQGGMPNGDDLSL